MGRLSLMLLAVIVCAGAAYLFLVPASLQPDRQALPITTRPGSPRLTASLDDVPALVHPASHPATLPGSRRLAPSSQHATTTSMRSHTSIHLPHRLAGTHPGFTNNPAPIHARAARVVLSLLRLPKALPAHTLRVPILMYHHISSQPPLTDLNAGLTVTDQDFAAQLDFLRQHGYHTVLLPQVFRALYQNRPLPPHPIVLTFDDGYNDNYTDALPILRRYHDVGEFNIISAYVGLTVGINSYMTWPRLHALVAAGMEIGSHTVDHQDLGILPVDKVRFELRDSRNILQRTLGVAVQFLAYPSGEPFLHGTLDAQRRVLALMPQYGYVGALLDGPLTTSLQNARAPFQLERIRVGGGEMLMGFAASLQQ